LYLIGINSSRLQSCDRRRVLIIGLRQARDRRIELGGVGREGNAVSGRVDHHHYGSDLRCQRPDNTSSVGADILKVRIASKGGGNWWLGQQEGSCRYANGHLQEAATRNLRTMNQSETLPVTRLIPATLRLRRQAVVSAARLDQFLKRNAVRIAESAG
jgi:hypothetical protein